MADTKVYMAEVEALSLLLKRDFRLLKALFDSVQKQGNLAGFALVIQKSEPGKAGRTLKVMNCKREGKGKTAL